MPIYAVTPEKLWKIEETSFSAARVRECVDLQRCLKNQIEIISPNILIIAEELGECEDSKRRNDLLGIDKNANLVVSELKKTDAGGHMDFQALCYAAMISTLTFHTTIQVYGDYQSQIKVDEDAERNLLKFPERDARDEENFSQDVWIVKDNFPEAKLDYWASTQE